MYFLPEIVSHTFKQRFYRFNRLRELGWVIFLDKSPDLLLLDHELQEWRWLNWANLFSSQRYLSIPDIHTSHDGQLMLVAINEGYAIVDIDGNLRYRKLYEQPLSERASFSFTDDGYLWVQRTLRGAAYTHELALLEPLSGKVVAQHQLTNHIDCSAFYYAPTSAELQWLFIDHNTQNFDTELYHVRRDGTTLIVEETEIYNEISYGVHPRGHEFLSIPQGEKHIVIRDYRSKRVVREVALADLVAQRDIWGERREQKALANDDDYPLFSRIDYLNDQLLLLCIEERHHYEFWLVDNMSLTLRGPIYPRRKFTPEEDFRQMWFQQGSAQREKPAVFDLTPVGPHHLVARWSDNMLQILDATALAKPEQLFTLADDGSDHQLRLFDDEILRSLIAPPRHTQ